MTIYVETLAGVPEVILGFTNRLRFRCSPHHDRDDTMIYELLGPYVLDVYTQHSQAGNAFVGRGNLLLLDPNNLSSLDHLSNLIGSRSTNPLSVWEVQIELSKEIVGEIDAARRRLGDTFVRLVFDWHTWVRERHDRTGGPVYGNSRNESVKQRTGLHSSGQPFISMSASEWFKVTEAYGFPKTRFIELVFPDVDKDRWLAAANDLLQGDRDFDLRRDRPSMAFCEQAFEEVLGKDVVMARPDQARNAIATLLQNWGLVDQRKRELICNLVYDTMVFVRRGKHDVDVAGHPEFDPNSGDAELGLLMTKALLGFLSKQ